jgi:hypothetical protein
MKPWEETDWSCKVLEGQVIIYCGERDFCLALDDDHPEDKALGTFIAAAPELFRALDGLFREFIEQVCGPRIKLSALCEAATALRKARGES